MKLGMATMGFEPTPPKRPMLKTSELDHSATLPDVFFNQLQKFENLGADQEKKNRLPSA